MHTQQTQNSFPDPKRYRDLLILLCSKQDNIVSKRPSIRIEQTEQNREQGTRNRGIRGTGKQEEQGEPGNGGKRVTGGKGG